MMQSHFQGPLLGCFEYVPSTALSIVCTINSGFLQIRIVVNFLLTSGYQPSLTKFLEDVAYFLKLILAFLPQIMNEILSDICVVVVKILLDTCKYITRLPYPLHRIDTSSSINSSNQEMWYNDNDSSTLYCCLYCCFALLFWLLSLAYSHFCYHGVLLYSFLRVVLLVLVVALVVGCVPSMSSSLSSSVVRRHLLAPSCCNHGVLLFRLFHVVSHCVVSIIVCIVVLHSCSCCCPGVIAIMVYCCILFFVFFFLFLLLLLLSVVCSQHLLLCCHPSFVVICLPLLVAITVYCCFVCFALCHIVSHCVTKLWLKLIWLHLQDRKKDSVKKISV